MTSIDVDLRKGILMAVDLHPKIDELVSDITHALGKSQITQQHHRKRRGCKRKNKLNLNDLVGKVNRLASENTSSEPDEIICSQDNKSQDNKSSLQLTDSDDLSPTLHPRPRVHQLTHHRAQQHNLVESDSVTEQFSPGRAYIKKKQKDKKMSLDEEGPSSSNGHPELWKSPESLVATLCKSKQLTHPSSDSDTKYVETTGKRKRGRERSMEWMSSQTNLAKCSTGYMNRKSVLHSGNIMEYESNSSSSVVEGNMNVHESSSSDSSSESDTNLFTCDEGREADDEQSDWFTEPGAVYGVPKDQLRIRRGFGYSSDSKLWYENMSQEYQQACRLRFQKLRERLLRREIRAGRRRVRDRRPGFNIICSVNEKVSKFLRDPMQTELHLRPMSGSDREQVDNLAALYSLEVTSRDNQTTYLRKTKKTITPILIDSERSFPCALTVQMGDLKRRKTSTPPPQNHTEGSNDSVESVITNPQVPGSSRPPVPTTGWDDYCNDSTSERQADSEPEQVPSPSCLALDVCSL